LKSKEVTSNGVKYSATYRNEKGQFESAQVIEYTDKSNQPHRAVYLPNRNIYVDSFTPKDHKPDANKPY
jgi:hypothetical protein